MADNIIPFDGITKPDIQVGEILDECKDHCTNGTVVIIGYNDNGEFYFSSSVSDGGTVLWLMETAKKILLEAGEDK